jgi:hypothetical protein
MQRGSNCLKLRAVVGEHPLAPLLPPECDACTGQVSRVQLMEERWLCTKATALAPAARMKRG